MLVRIDGELISLHILGHGLVICIRFSGGFIWTTSIHQIFTRETELSYFLAFGNCLMAEVSRLASIVADRQKADFIGSISHEFRSPLHGKNSKAI